MKSSLLYFCSILCVLPSLGADVDFSTQRLPIQVPPADGDIWSAKSIAKRAFPEVWIYDKVYEYIWKRNETVKDILIGHVLCPKTLVAENSELKRGVFAIRRL
ncbi:MAG: hypothetical protein Q8M07_05025, partial [Prosthecobacter sp.]|nr:hypothetical protein [Prosthecobacter sp.]